MNTDVIDAELIEDTHAEKHGELAVAQAPAQANLSIFTAESAQERVEEMVEVAQAFLSLARKRDAEAKAANRAPLIVVMKNKKTGTVSEYITLPLWQTLGMMPRNAVAAFCEWTRPIEGGYEARAIVRTLDGREVSAAESQCEKSEGGIWQYSNDNARRSMAQTRAQSKALRSALGFLVVLAGFEATPAEEMPQPNKNVSQSTEHAGTMARLGESTSRGAEGDTSTSLDSHDEKAKEGARKVLFATYPALRNKSWRHDYLEQVYAKESLNDLTLEQLRDLYTRLKNNV